MYRCRTISRYVCPLSADQRSTNSCVRSCSSSWNTRRTPRSFAGSSKRNRIVCSPGPSARQPCAPAGMRADSIRWEASSDVTSIWMRHSRSSHSRCSPEGVSRRPCSMIRLRIDTPLISFGVNVADSGAHSRQAARVQQAPENDPGESQFHERAAATAKPTKCARMAMSVANPSRRRHRHRDARSRSGPGSGRRECHNGALFSPNASAGRRRVTLSRRDRPGSPEPNRQILCRLYCKSLAARHLICYQKWSHPRRFVWTRPLGLAIAVMAMLRRKSRSVALFRTVRFSLENINKCRCFRTVLPDE